MTAPIRESKEKETKTSIPSIQQQTFSNGGITAYGQLRKFYTMTKSADKETLNHALTQLSPKMQDRIHAIIDKLYSNNLKNRFLTSSGLPHNFRSHSRLASWQWSFAPNKNSEDPPCQNPDSSSCLCISTGRKHVLDSLPRLQQAIQQIAINKFDTLPRHLKKLIATRVFSENNPIKDDVEILLDSLDYRTCSPKELQTITATLDAWASEEIDDENRSDARTHILTFLNHSSEIELSLDGLSLSVLPKIFHAIPFITRLENLSLTNNCLSDLPAEIYKLRQLKYLNVSTNSLSTLSEKIGNLQTLTRLHASQNLLTTLPIRIDQLKRLHLLNIAKNPLTSLPGEILALPQNCHIHLHNNHFSETVRRQLATDITTIEHYGPIFLGFSRPIHSDLNGSPLTLKQTLYKLFLIAKKDPTFFSHLINYSDNTEDLIQWLNRLSLTKNYQQGGAFQIAFARHILTYLEEADRNPAFRKIFFLRLQEAAITCGDRVALSILYIGIDYRLITIHPMDTRNLEALLIHGIWTVDLLEQVAREKIAILKNTGVFNEEHDESLQVYLAYLVMLREKLQIPMDIQGMLYFVSSHLTEEELIAAAEYVQQIQANNDTYCNFLIKQEKWLAALHLRFPTEMAAIDETVEKRLSEDEPDETAILTDKNCSLMTLSQRLRDENRTVLQKKETKKSKF